MDKWLSLWPSKRDDRLIDWLVRAKDQSRSTCFGDSWVDCSFQWAEGEFWLLMVEHSREVPMDRQEARTRDKAWARRCNGRWCQGQWMVLLSSYVRRIESSMPFAVNKSKVWQIHSKRHWWVQWRRDRDKESSNIEQAMISGRLCQIFFRSCDRRLCHRGSSASFSSPWSDNWHVVLHRASQVPTFYSTRNNI